MKNSKLALTLVAASVALIGCGEQKPPAKAEGKAPAEAAKAAPAGIEVKIGHVGPLTGGIAHLGKDNENGARLAIEQANDAKVQIDGKPATFVLVAEDDQADPKVGTTVAQKLVDAKVAGVVGHLNSGVSIPASDIYNKAGIPVISGSSTNPKLTEQGFKVQFRVVARDDQQGNKYLAAYAAMRAQGELTSQKVFAYLRDRLPPHLLPDAIVLLKEFRLTPNGKIDRKVLPGPREAEFVNRRFAYGVSTENTPVDRQYERGGAVVEK